MMAEPTFPLTVFYDGSCIVCSREIGRYRGLSSGDRLRFIDISAPDFAAETYGRSREEFMVQLHVRDARGVFFLGVDAFPVLWSALPGAGYRWLVRCIGLPGIHLLAVIGYRLFARLRIYLPRRRDGACGEGCRRPGHRH